MASYNCLTCTKTFENEGLLRDHYKSEWHVYNVRLKYNDLSVISLEDFQSRKGDSQSTTVIPSDYSCRVCNKCYNSKNALNSHLKSKKHINRKKKSEDIKSEGEEFAEEQYKNSIEDKANGNVPKLYEKKLNTIGEFMCLFCIDMFLDHNNLFKHMAKIHSFNIPFKNYLPDKIGFYEYLSSLINEYQACLYCGLGSREFPDVLSTKMHMRDKSHCSINSLDITTLYNKFYRFPEGYDRYTSFLAAEYTRLNVDPTTLELILDNGRRLGHRYLKDYYKQNLTYRFVDDYKQCKLKGTSFAPVRDSNGQLITSEEAKRILKSQRDEFYKRSYDQTKISISANKHQKYFRDQTPKLY